MEWWSTLVFVIFLIIALLLMTLIVYFSWSNGISPLPASSLLCGEVTREVHQIIQRLDTLHLKQHIAAEIVDQGTFSATNAEHDMKIKSCDVIPFKLVEAGSGWGTLAMHLKRHFPALHVTGIENSPVPYLASRGLAWLRRSRIALIRGDLYHYDYRDTDLIVCYLFPGAMQRLSTLWREQCRQDAYIISVYFALPGWEPEHMITCRDIHRTRIYIYRAGHRSYVV